MIGALIPSGPRIMANRIGRRANWALGLWLAALCGIGIAWNTDFEEPPRFDGAGYAMLGRSLLETGTYRNIDHPEAPAHRHFPPGYPLVLAGLWTWTGPSARAAHVASTLCTVGAVVLAWRWFAALYRSGAAGLLGTALAMNWAWQRSGGAIRSEPVYLLLQQLVILGTLPAARAGLGRSFGLGLGLGVATLTRHVGAALNLAIALELVIRRRWRTLGIALATSALVVAPWAIRLLSAPASTQLGLFPDGGLAAVVFENARFYIIRIPDVLIGPLFEYGTVFEPRLAVFVTISAVALASVWLVGTVCSLRKPATRLAGLIVVVHLGLLLVWPFTEAGRFLIPLVPALLIVAVEGFEFGVRRLPGTFRDPSRLAATLLLAASLPYPLYAIATQRAEADRAAHRELDAACAWLNTEADQGGPVMSTYPAEVFWQTGRLGVRPPEADPSDLARKILTHKIAYLLVSSERFAKQPPSRLERFVAEHPKGVRRAWTSTSGDFTLFEVNISRVPPKLGESPR